MQEIIITPLEEGQRLDRLLGKYLNQASGSFLYKMLRKKNITLNGKKAGGGEKLAAGDVVRIYFSKETLDKFTGRAERPAPAAYAGHDLFRGAEPEILYEDENVLLLNKPAGILTQKARPEDVSLNEFAIAHLIRSGAVREEQLALFKPSVCNRLDRNTSGIVAVGKNTQALQELSALFRDRTVHKFYTCLVAGNVRKEQTIEGMLVKDEKANRVTVRKITGKETGEADNGQFIRTRYIPLAHHLDKNAAHDLTLLKVELITGRSHQIRAHLSSVGHPIAGDPKYGDRAGNDYFRREYGLKRQLLHAGELIFPKLEGPLADLSDRCFTAPVPEDFAKVLAGEGIQNST